MTRALTSVQRQILSYLDANTNAAETAEGINVVWLNRANTAQSIAETEESLDGLVALDLMERHALPGGTALYRSRRAL